MPPRGLAELALLGGFLGRSTAVALALPLHFCEHASVPLAVVLWSCMGVLGSAEKQWGTRALLPFVYE